ncbi:hypothetical protein [uncultured Mitsuokella sp.]|nr:hypothetical protein [uncultured Mitsuokella sp.]
MESRKKRRRHLNPRIVEALEAIMMAIMGVGTAALLAQFFGILLGIIDPN